jgi:5-hydroxyisourate hydrolase-like protein (transthyretin family)
MTENVATRGGPVHVRGDVAGDGTPCANVVVAISVRSSTGTVSPLGELATDEHGAYTGSITVPKELAVGDYELVASTPGNTLCGAGTSR